MSVAQPTHRVPDPRGRDRLQFLGAWMAATIAAEAIGFASAMAIGRGLYVLLDGETFDKSSELALSLLVGVIEGACRGAGQWRILRRRAPEIGAGAWIAATASGGAFAWILGMGVGPHVTLPRRRPSSPWP